MKSVFLWQIRNCTHGNPDALAACLRADNIGKVYIKFTNGNVPYNLDADGKNTLLHRFVYTLRANKIEVQGWGYSYGADIPGELLRIEQVVREFGLTTWVFDVEAEWKTYADRATRARKLWGGVRAEFPNLKLALCSYRFPSYHPEIPWADFLAGMDLHMPQVYWVGATNAGAQLRQSVTELTAKRALPVIPVGAAYEEGGWKPTAGQIADFGSAAKSLNLSEISFWCWDTAGIEEHPELERAIAALDWGAVPPLTPPPAPEPTDAEKLRILWDEYRKSHTVYLPLVSK